MAAILDCAKKTNFARLYFSRLLVCYSRDLSDHKTIEKPSVAICGGSFSILIGLLLAKWIEANCVDMISATPPVITDNGYGMGTVCTTHVSLRSQTSSNWCIKCDICHLHNVIPYIEWITKCEITVIVF